MYLLCRSCYALPHLIKNSCSQIVFEYTIIKYWNTSTFSVTSLLDNLGLPYATLLRGLGDVVGDCGGGVVLTLPIKELWYMDIGDDK